MTPHNPEVVRFKSHLRNQKSGQNQQENRLNRQDSNGFLVYCDEIDLSSPICQIRLTQVLTQIDKSH